MSLNDQWTLELPLEQYIDAMIDVEASPIAQLDMAISQWMSLVDLTPPVILILRVSMVRPLCSCIHVVDRWRRFAIFSIDHGIPRISTLIISRTFKDVKLPIDLVSVKC